ncbi:hypothetical protein GCM10022223_33450 [Kineosporia mesophila]|uniref:Uncharacterized protein n=1 Tax=Kineosporia mesophila TaxID=566012 RepID=A0ABP6ZPS6_9ACTN
MMRVLLNPKPGQATVGSDVMAWLTLCPQDAFGPVGLLTRLAQGTVNRLRVKTPSAEAVAALSQR